MRKRILYALLIVGAFALAAGAAHQTLVYMTDGGDRLVVASSGQIDIESGGDIDIESGGALKLAGTAITSTAAELNILDGVTSTAAELNILDGVTATASEINTAADGITATAAELNALDGVTGGTVTASKALIVDGNKDLASLRHLTITGDLTVSSDSTGGNAGARSQIIGLPKLTLAALGTMTNGTTETVAWMDTTPTGEWAEVDAGTNLTATKDTTYYRVGAESLKLTVSTVAENDGVDATAPAQDDWSGNESFGFWIYSDEALTAGDLDLTVDDSDGTDQVYNLPEVAANTWTWVEIDISGCNANCDTVDGVYILFTAQGAGALTDPDIYIDGVYKWDADDEETLGVNLVQDGVLSVLKVATAAGSANTPSSLAEHTDYFTHYQSGNDAVVTITDQSAGSGVAMVAYQ